MSKKEEIIVIGHKNPDSDTIISAYVWSNILRRKGEPAQPASSGKLNGETKLVFEEAGVNPPEKKDLAGKDLFLVDHNSPGQMVGDLDQVVGVVDHHKLSGLETDGAIYFRNEPLGSTSSLIKKITDEQMIELNDEEKFLLLCGIISDTLKLTSPTTTEVDESYVKELGEDLEVDIDKLAEEMFEAKSDFSGMSLKEIILADYKDYELEGEKVGVGVAEVASTSYFDETADEKMIKKLKEVKKEEGLDYLFFGVIDILKKDTTLYLLDEEEGELAEEAFNINYNSNKALLKGVASRKKQIIPPLSEALNK